jgi:hypothetical protein
MGFADGHSSFIYDMRTYIGIPDEGGWYPPDYDYHNSPDEIYDSNQETGHK